MSSKEIEKFRITLLYNDRNDRFIKKFFSNIFVRLGKLVQKLKTENFAS